MATATKAARGTKRTCQNDDCEARFYDLNRDPIACPVCGEAYAIAVETTPTVPERPGRRPHAKAPVYVSPDAQKSGDDDAPDGEEALADIEVEEDAADVSADETFLEEEEDSGSDVSGLVGDSGDDKDEQ